MTTDIAEVSVNSEKQELQVFSKLTGSAVPPALHIVGAVVVIFYSDGKDGNVETDSGSAGWQSSSAETHQSANLQEAPGQGTTKCIPASLSVLPAPPWLGQLPPGRHERSESRDSAFTHPGSLDRMPTRPLVPHPSRSLKRSSIHHVTQSKDVFLQQNQCQENMSANLITSNAETSISNQSQQKSAMELGQSVEVVGVNSSESFTHRDEDEACNSVEANESREECNFGEKEQNGQHNFEVIKLEPPSPEHKDTPNEDCGQAFQEDESASAPETFVAPCGSMILQLKEDQIDSDEENFEVVTHVNCLNDEDYHRYDAVQDHSKVQLMTVAKQADVAPQSQLVRRAVAKRGRHTGRIRTGTSWLSRPSTPARLRYITCAICQSTVRSYAELLHHISEHQHLSPRPLCPICYESFEDGVGLRRHAALHFPNPPVKCPICRLQYSHVESLRRHFHNSHPGQQLSLKRYLHQLATRGRTRPQHKAPRAPGTFLSGSGFATPSATLIRTEFDACGDPIHQGKATLTSLNPESMVSKDVSSDDKQPAGGKLFSSSEESDVAAREGSHGPCLSDLDPRVWGCEGTAGKEPSAEPAGSTQVSCAAHSGARDVVVIDLDSGTEDDNRDGLDVHFSSAPDFPSASSQLDSQEITRDAVDQDGKVHGTCRRTMLNGKEQELYICNYCQQPFTRYGNFRRHLKSKHPQALGYSAEEADKKFTCPVCLHDYNRSDNLKYHIRKKHAESYDLIFNSTPMSTSQEVSDSKPSESTRLQQPTSSWPLIPWDSQSHSPARTLDESARQSSATSIPKDGKDSDREPCSFDTSSGSVWLSQLSQPGSDAVNTGFRRDLSSQTEDHPSGSSGQSCYPCNFVGSSPDLSPVKHMASKELPPAEHGSTSFSVPFNPSLVVPDATPARFNEVMAITSSQSVFPSPDQFYTTNQTMRSDSGELGMLVSVQEHTASTSSSFRNALSALSCSVRKTENDDPAASSQESSAIQVPKAPRGKPSFVSEEMGSGKQRGPCQCSVCKNTISTREDFAQHIKWHALDISDNVCPICLLSFSTYFNLLRHASRHLGTTPYTCPICSNSINRLDNFKIHLKNHTNIPPEILAQLKAADMDPSDNCSN